MVDRRELPDLDGWYVQRHADGTWTATRRGSLSEAQYDFGCRLRLRARCFGALEMLAVGEDTKATLIAAAEQLDRALRERDPWREGER